MGRVSKKLRARFGILAGRIKRQLAKEGIPLRPPKGVKDIPSLAKEGFDPIHSEKIVETSGGIGQNFAIEFSVVYASDPRAVGMHSDAIEIVFERIFLFAARRAFGDTFRKRTCPYARGRGGLRFNRADIKCFKAGGRYFRSDENKVAKFVNGDTFRKRTCPQGHACPRYAG